MPTLSSRLFNIIDASILIAALFGVFYLFGYFYYERLFFALGLPKSILMPSYNVIVTRGWIVAWTLDVRIINIVSIIIFTTILAYFFYLPRIKTYVDKIFLDRNTENKKSKTINFILYCSNKLKYVCILIVCFLFVFFYVNDRAYEQANRTSNCFSSGIYNEAACRFYPPLEILTDIPVDGSK